MIIYGKSRDEHDVHFLNFLSIVKKNNLRLNVSTLQLQLEGVSFFGHNWNSKGISPDPKKIQSIKQMVSMVSRNQCKASLGWSIS